LIVIRYDHRHTKFNGVTLLPLNSSLTALPETYPRSYPDITSTNLSELAGKLISSHFAAKCQPTSAAIRPPALFGHSQKCIGSANEGAPASLGGFTSTLLATLTF
jgi:hypothetical protein